MKFLELNNDFEDFIYVGTVLKRRVEAANAPSQIMDNAPSQIFFTFSDLCNGYCFEVKFSKWRF